MAAFFVGLVHLEVPGASVSSRTAFWLTMLAAVAFLCRIDVTVLFAPALVWLAWVRWKAHGIRGLRPLVLGGLPAVAWLLFSIVYYGFPFPNTYYAKASAGFPPSVQLSQGVAYVLNSLRFDPITLTTIGIAVGCAVGGGRRQTLIAVAAVLNVVYVVWVGGTS